MAHLVPIENHPPPLWWQIFDGIEDFRHQSNAWLPDINQSIAASQLLTLPVIDCTNGIQKMNLTVCVNSSPTEDARLITRQGMRAVYDCVADRIIEGAKGTTFLVEGAPGTSKSRNLLYLLRRLLFANKLVIFEYEAGNDMYIFVPPQGELNIVRAEDDDTQDRNRYEVYSVANPKHCRACAALKFSDAVYLFDPSLSVDSKEPPIVYCNLVIAASSNKNYKQSVKHDYVVNFITNPYTLDEVIEFFAALAPDPVIESVNPPLTPLSEQALRDAFFFVGFSLLYTFSIEEVSF